ncbi:MAG TPA: type II toxin-antitoxin system RelE/ParE family toxin [Methanomicrobia archaeon]|nr:type II toxin-antitoxin system RelE/ParE family toxin [Methanomicrobia archaeon]
MYSIKTTNQFERKIKKIDKSIRGNIIEKISELKQDPYKNVKKLHGKLRGMYSLRIGEYRVIFSIDEEKNFIVLLTVGHRKRIYKE